MIKALCRNGKRAFIEIVWSGKRVSNSRPPPWQGGALPLSYSRINLTVVGERRVELLRLAALVPKTSVSAIPPLARMARST